MSDRCYSTLVCSKRDKDIFQKMGYKLKQSQALTVDGDEIAGAVVMVDEEANNGHYDELLVLTATTSLFRTARNGTTPKPCMRATIRPFGWRSAG